MRATPLTTTGPQNLHPARAPGRPVPHTRWTKHRGLVSGYYEISNATNIKQLGGLFSYVSASVSLGFGPSASTIVFTNGHIVGLGLGLAIGFGDASGVSGLSKTYTYTFGRTTGWFMDLLWDQGLPGGLNTAALLRFARLELRHNPWVQTLSTCKAA